MKLAGSISASVTLTPISPRYWGMSTNSSASITDADILATVGGSKDLVASRYKGTSPGFEITGSGPGGAVKYAFYAIASRLTDLPISSIMVGGFESIDAYIKTTRNLTNALGYTESYDIYVQKNASTDTIKLIIQ
jgi:hypothetical protein